MIADAGIRMVATLDYGRAKQRRPWLLVVTILVLTLFAMLAWNRRHAWQGWIDLIQLRSRVIHAPTLSQPLTLTSAGEPPASDVVLWRRSNSRLSSWMAPLNAIVAEMPTLGGSVLYFNNTGASRAYVGLRRPTAGVPRLVEIGLLVAGGDELGIAPFAVIVQLHNPGTIWQPRLADVAIKSAGGGATPYPVPGGERVIFEPLFFDTNKQLTICPPVPIADDPASIRLPIVIDGVAESFRITLGTGDTIGLYRENDGPLPIRPASASQPATRSAE